MCNKPFRRPGPVLGLMCSALTALGLLLSIPVLAQDLSTPSPDSLSGSLGLRKFEERGVIPFAGVTEEVWGNVAGGLEQRGWWIQLLEFGVELDTGKLGWWEGGVFKAEADWVLNLRRSVTFDQYTGGFSPVSSLMASDHLRVYNLNYQHAWREDKVLTRAGLIAADDDFMLSDYAGLFLNASFGPMPSQVGTPLAASGESHPAFPVYPVTAPGVFLRVRPFESFYTQLGLYYGRAGFDTPDNHGFGWAELGPPELGLFWESGYSWKLAGRPNTTRLGLSYHTGPLHDFRECVVGDSSATGQAVPNFYLVHDLELLARAEDKPKLGLFGRAGIVPEPGLSIVALYADAGLNWFAPFPGRPDDIAGLGVSYTQFGNAYRRSICGRGLAANQTTLELTYKAQITPWMSIQADAQWLFNPAVNPESGSRETATILGVRAQIRF